MTNVLCGDWHGVLDSGYRREHLAIRIESSAAGLSGSARPAKQTSDTALTIETTGPDTYAIAIPRYDLSLHVTLDASAQRLSGTWRQQGVQYPLILERGLAARTLQPRPQTPTGPFPYLEQRVTFKNADAIDLAGTLTFPADVVASPCVVLAQMLGSPDRDESFAGHKPFAIWADNLTRRGLAVLRFDKRGAGESDGNHADATTRDFADDLASAVAYARTRSQIDPRRIGLLGHSEGGNQAAIVAADDRAIAFCVCLTPSGLTGEETLLNQMRAMALSAGRSAQESEENVKFEAALYGAVRRSGNRAEAEAAAKALLLGSAPNGRYSARRAALRLETLLSPWLRFWLGYDPRPSLGALQCPVLVVLGAKDQQTLVATHAAPIRSALAQNGQAHIHILEGLNHVLQHAVSGAPSEYGDIEETISPEVLELVGAWISGGRKSQTMNCCL
ncbi:MAG TPA: alpha/beta fold hydrolase [Rhizomicrobium sp.]